MAERDKKLQNWVEQIAGKYGLIISSMKSASSDASFRSYYRIQGNDSTYILMDCPSSAGSIEPFIKADKVFADAGLNVPKIYEEDSEQGFLLCSDLGSVTYLDIISNQNAKELMSDATDALVKLQLASKPGVFPIYSEGILLTELELFPQWYVARHLNYKMTPKEHEVMT
ncbi:MAG: phosphotransferase, partial [Burkholderiales bacterium]|nr:phosphotransferase [Burkholderiales bacterium]